VSLNNISRASSATINLVLPVLLVLLVVVVGGGGGGGGGLLQCWVKDRRAAQAQCTALGAGSVWLPTGASLAKELKPLAARTEGRALRMAL
jgi:hypothetical protein